MIKHVLTVQLLDARWILLKYFSRSDWWMGLRMLHLWMWLHSHLIENWIWPSRLSASPLFTYLLTFCLCIWHCSYTHWPLHSSPLTPYLSLPILLPQLGCLSWTRRPPLGTNRRYRFLSSPCMSSMSPRFRLFLFFLQIMLCSLPLPQMKEYFKPSFEMSQFVILLGSHDSFWDVVREVSSEFSFDQ